MNSGPLSDWREEGIPNIERVSVRIRRTTIGAHLLVVRKASLHPENVSMKNRQNLTLLQVACGRNLLASLVQEDAHKFGRWGKEGGKY